MKIKKLFITISSIALVIGTSVALAIFHSNEPNKIVATQNINNYDPYTYSGSYYDGFNFYARGGMNGSLRKALTSKIKPNEYYIYDSNGAGHLSEVLQGADEDPNNSSNMIYFYTRDSVPKTAATVNNVVQWNREHVWCQSLSNSNWGKYEAGTDILHLRPTYESTNKSRGNTAYGDVNKVNPRTYNDMVWGYSNGTYFEPLDSVKGDVARIIMYLWTTYNGYIDKDGNPYNPLNITDIFESYDTLLRWHTMDQPDALEGHRNDYAESSNQGNRNPFVDHPELGWRIFGNAASQEIDNACREAYPFVGGLEPIEPTGVSFESDSVDIVLDASLQLNAALIPNDSDGIMTYSSSDTTVASVDVNGVVTANAVGSATITASVSNSIYVACTVNVIDGASLDYTKVASYDFSSGNSATSEYQNTNNVLTRFNNSSQSGEGLSNIVTGVSNMKKLYPGYSNYLNYGLKLGTSSDAGTFTVSLNKQVGRVVVNAAGWGTSDSLKVGGAKAQTPGVAYDSNNAIKELNYYINPSNSVSFTFNKRGFIQSIEFYEVTDHIYTPNDFLNNTTTFADLSARETSSYGDVITISKTIAQVSGNPANGTRVADLVLDTNIGFSVNPDGNNGKVYSSGTEWRLYQTNSAVVNVSASNNYVITSVKFTYTVSNTGVLKYGEDTLTSGSPVSIDHLSSALFTVANSGEATNGIIKVTAIEVKYVQRVLDIDQVSLTFGLRIPKTDWDHINELEDYQITDYGLMLFRTSEEELGNVFSVKGYYDADKALATVRSNTGNPPDLIEGNYVFSVQINITRVSSYNIYYCVAPFIKVNDTYYFLNERRESVNSLAASYEGDALSEDALTYLATTH